MRVAKSMQRRALRVLPSTPLQHLDDVDADARHLDARGERGAVAVVDAAALRLDVEAALALVLRGLLPRRAVLDLHAVRARHEPAEAERHDPAEQAHADPDPLRARGIEVLHGSAFACGPGSACALALARLGRTLACARIGRCDPAPGGSMPRSVRATISTRSGVL